MSRKRSIAGVLTGALVAALAMPAAHGGPYSFDFPAPERVSLRTSGGQMLEPSVGAAVSDDGRFVAFESEGSNVVSSPSGVFGSHVYVRDRQAGTTELVSRSTAGTPGSGVHRNPVISDDGRYVLFESSSDNLVPGDTNDASDLFVRDRTAGTTTRVSLGAGGVQLPDSVEHASYDLSGNGRYVTFSTYSRAVANDTDDQEDVYRFDRDSNAVVRVSRHVTTGSGATSPKISDDGSRIVFTTGDSLDGALDDHGIDAYVWTQGSAQLVLASRGSDGRHTASMSWWGVDISGDGSTVVFETDAESVVSGSPNPAANRQVYTRTLTTNTTRLVSGSPSGVVGNGPSWSAGITDDASGVAFLTKADNLVGNVPGTDSAIAWASMPGRSLGLVTLGTQVDEGDAAEMQLSLAGSGAVAAFTTDVAAQARDTNDEYDVYTVATPVPPQRFSDVPLSHQFWSEVDWMAATAISTGYADGTFKPTAPVTRQALASFLWKLAGSPAPSSQATFSDVPSNHPFRAAISWMAAEGISTGYADGTFKPTAPVTRQAMASFMWRIEDEASPSGPAPTFNDVTATHPFRIAIWWMYGEGITGGYADGGFKPTAAVTRQAMSAFLLRWQTD